MAQGVSIFNGALGSPAKVSAGLLTGCQDRPYVFGLATALAEKCVNLDVLGDDSIDSLEMHRTVGLNFLNLMPGRKLNAGSAARIAQLLRYYVRLLWYAATGEPKIFHILWNNRLEYFDRTLLTLYFKALSKKVVITAHNVNQARRDSKDSRLNRLTLRMQYRLVDHIFVHTKKMKAELIEDFGVGGRKVTVIRHPINNAFPDTDLTPATAKQRLGLEQGHKVILFFGRLRPYKGLDVLLTAFQHAPADDPSYRLVIAGESKKGAEKYFDEIQQVIMRHPHRDQIIQRIQFIPDAETELYFKAADVLVLPYKEIFQSGVLFLGYTFGLPVVAADVGSFREEIVEGRTGFLCRPNDPADLARAIKVYFESDLFRELSRRRQEIKDYAEAHHSWDAVAEQTREVYAALLRNSAEAGLGEVIA